MFIRVGATLFSDKEVLDSGVLVVSTVKYMWYHIPDLAELKINILESTVDPNSLAFTEITGNTSLAPRDFILMNLIGVGVVILTLFSRWLSLFFVRQLSLRYPLFLDGYLMIKGKLKQARQIIRLSRTLSKNYDNLKSILINVAKGYAFVAVRIVSSAPSASAAVLATAAVVATASVDVEQANDLWALLLDELSVVRLLASDVGDVVSPDEAGALFGAVYHLDPLTDLPYLSNTDYQQLDAQGKFAYRY